MRLINLTPLHEIDFPSQAAFDTYSKNHKLRPDTKVNIAGKNTTAGKAAQSSTPVKGTSVFGGDKEKTSTSPIPKAQPGSFLDAFQKLNPGYDANKTLADFSKESEADLYDTDSDTEDIADHEAYVKSATDWFNKVATAKPTVKPGDLVKVNMKSTGKEGIGKIVEPVTMQGNYGFMGQVAPDKQPAWKIDCYTEKNIGTSKKPIDVNGKKYYYQGTLYYPQHEEGDKEAFSKLGNDNKKSDTSLSSMIPNKVTQQYNPAQAFNQKVSKMTDNNAHSAAAVELAIYMDDKEAVSKLQQIKKYHDNRGYLQPGEAKERGEIVNNLLQRAQKELPKKDFDLVSSAF